MLNDYNAYENDIGYFYDVEPIVDIEHFVLLLLADLAKKSPYIFFNQTKDKIAVLPVYYKEVIQNIMYEENGWGIKFSKLIDIRYYYEHQLEWEEDLVNAIKKILKSLKKEFVYNIDEDVLEINFTQDEIEDIRGRYDEKILEIMNRFSNLIGDTIYNRRDELERRDTQRRIDRRMTSSYNFLVRKLRDKGIRNPEKYLKN